MIHKRTRCAWLGSREVPAAERRVEEEKGKKGERWMPRLSGGEEGRGKLRKGAGICKQEMIRAYPNGATRQVEDLALP